MKFISALLLVLLTSCIDRGKGHAVGSARIELAQIQGSIEMCAIERPVQVSDLRQSRRLEIVNRSKRVNLGAAQSGFGLRTVPTDPGVGLPSPALGYRAARQLHCVPPSRPNSPAPRSAGPQSSFASLHRSAQCG